MRTRGRGLKKEVWFSICSIHGDYNENCNICNAGGWRNVYKMKFENALHAVSWRLWFRYMNGHWPEGTYEDYTGMQEK